MLKGSAVVRKFLRSAAVHEDGIHIAQLNDLVPAYEQPNYYID
jgi:hypothetical protein